MPFAPGTSGNPGGRPRTDHRVRDLAREQTENAIATLVNIMEDKAATAAARVAAASAILDRGWGKAAQPLEHSGDVALMTHEAALDALCAAIDELDAQECAGLPSAA